jgi:transposase-like protein
MAYSVEVKKEFVTLRAEGRSYKDIAEKLNVACSTLKNWALELKREIIATELEHTDDLLAQSRLNRAAAMKDTVIELEKVKQSIKKKSYDEESMKTLHEMKTKMEKEITGMAHSTQKSLERCN